tara:strand:- start:246 stop:1745 length:1500 start_codon:yes stop_codon:yes gene_type:complete
MKSDRENAVYEALTSHSSEASSSPKKGQGWKLTRGPRGGRNRSIGATTPTSTSGRSYRYRDVDTRGAALKVSDRRRDEWNRGETRNWGTRRWGSDKDKNINRETINPNKMEKAETDARTAAKYQNRKPSTSIMEQRWNRKRQRETADIQPEDPNRAKPGEWKGGKWRELLKAAVYEYLHKRQEPNPEKLKELLDAGKIDQAGYDALVSGKAGSAPAVKKPQDALESARARHFGRKRLGENIRADQSGERSAQRQRDVYRQQMEKAEDNIYAIATAAAEGKGEDKKEEIVRALKRGKMILKAFGVPISMPGGKLRILPVIPNSEGGFFTKETSGRHSLHPVARRPKTVTEKERDSHADGGEEYSSGARGATPALLGMIKALADDMSPEQKKKIMDKLGNALIYPEFDSKKPEGQQGLPFSTEDEEHIAPTPEPQKPLPHGDDLPQPTQRGGSRQGSRRKGDIPKGGWMEAALLWPTQPEDNGKGRKVKTRVGDSIGGYPT